MRDLVIDIDLSGSSKALHTEAFDLSFLGPMYIARQTDIVFNSDTQLWDMYYIECSNEFECKSTTLKKVVPLSGRSSYEDARTVEVLWLNDCRLLGIDPVSIEGIEVASMVSENMSKGSQVR